jgi:hypothetical protein
MRARVRFTRLYAQAKVVASKRDVAAGLVHPECTFKPELVASKSATTTRSGNVFDILYKKVRPRAAHHCG